MFNELGDILRALAPTVRNGMRELPFARKLRVAAIVFGLVPAWMVLYLTRSSGSLKTGGGPGEETRPDGGRVN